MAASDDKPNGAPGEKQPPEQVEVEAALVRYWKSCDSGELPDRGAFLDTHPELKEQLNELLEAADWIEQLAGPTLADLQASPKPNSEPPSAGGDTLPHSVSLEELHSAADEETIGRKPKASARDISQPVLPCTFGDYVLERVLGRGGMGVVYYGRQTRLDRSVAVKMIRSGALASDEEVARFYAEARSAAKLAHPNIVTVYQCGEQDGHRYFSMDYVAGTDLAKLTKDGPIDAKKAAKYVRDAAKAIQYAHDQGILHRDLKPANLLVDENDIVRITDFGLAKSIEHETGLTATGAALGTPSYMSPEQAAGRVSEQSNATDVYSLGAVLFTIVTGKPPFKGSSVLQTLMQVIHRPAPMVRGLQSNLDADIETITDRCLQKAPERRYESAATLADDLDRYLDGRPIKARPMPHHRRAWHWLLGVPVFGAVLDNRVVEPTEAHRWVQRGLVSVGVMILVAWLAMMLSTIWYKNHIPRTVRVAAGVEGGDYSQLANTICNVLEKNAPCKAIPVVSAGSMDNLEKLRRSEVDVALLQQNAVDSGDIAVLAPLYYEAVHVLVKTQLKITSVQELAQHRIVVGEQMAGSSRVAQMVLDRAGLTTEEVQLDRSDWRKLATEGSADAAIVVTKCGSEIVTTILKSGKYRLIPLADPVSFQLDEPSFRYFPLVEKHYPECGLDANGIVTVATTAFLAASNDTPAILVKAILSNLYTPDTVAATGILRADEAAHWQGVAWHPAAREFFRDYRGAVPVADKSR